MTSDEGTSLHSYLQQVLANPGIPAPDGRPLYAYRLTETQFETLQNTLRSKLDSYLKFGTLGALANSNEVFCALFVLYAAEWWRRRYDGSKWAWEPILADLGVSQDSWSSIQRNDCVARGLNKWQLRISETAGYRYLGAVAVQGGLPMQLLAAARGNIGRILRGVLGLARGGTAGFTEIRGWIASLKNELPKSYQKEDIYVLLTEVITSVLDLRKEAGLTKSAEAVAQLDQQMPGWRDRFPLPVEDNEVQGLIEKLIRDVTDVQEKKPGCALRVERSLELQNDEIWKISSNIVVLPETLSTQDICSLFQITDSDSIPRIIEFVIEASDHNLSINTRRMAGHDRYHLERRPCEFSGQVAMGEHRLTLRATDGRHWIAPLRNGEPLDQELPWIFEQFQQNSPRLVRQGGGSVQAVEALVAIPCGWNVETGSGSSCVLKAFVENPDREVYEIKGDATISDTLGHRWTVKTGQANATEESYQWSGDRVWEEFLRPNLAFRGRPILREIHGEAGESRIPEHRLNWQPPNISAGPVEVTYKERQELRHRGRMVLLPKEARVSLEPKSLNCGTIHLHHWHVLNVLTETAGVDLRMNRDGDSLAIICSSHDATPPEWIEIEAIWEGNTTHARIRLPFPSEGARAFDANGTEFPKDAWLSAQRLAGIRLVAMFRSPVPVELRFRLRHTKEQNNAHEARHKIRTVNGSSRIDIRLQDYADDIDRLLAADELLDAWVEVSLSLNHKEALRIRVSRYACHLERVAVASDVQLTAQGMRLIAPEILNTLPVFALRLEQPGEEAISLPAKLSEGVPTGAWEFVSTKREPGSWLIYPGPDSALTFRPTLWIIPGESAGSTELTQALSIEDREYRAAELDRVIQKMSTDFLDPCWGDLERLAEHLGHLPLATLDLWRRIVHSPSGMAALALRLNNLPAGFLRRFPLEQPFVWELVSINEWLAAADQLKKQCVAWFGEAASPQQFADLLNVRIEELTTHQPALSKLLGIVKSVVLNNGCQEIKMMRAAGSDAHFQQQLFSGEKSALQKLLRDHSDDTWPPDSGLFVWINNTRQDRSFVHLFPNDSLAFQDGVIGLPIMLAIQVATNAAGDWFTHSERMHILRTYQAFDPDWFTEAFDLTIARCLSTGVMKI